MQKESSSTFTPTKQMPPTKSSSKVRVHLRAAGSAPELKKRKFQIEEDTTIRELSSKLRSWLKLPSVNTSSEGHHNGGSSGGTSGGSLFLYCNQAFVPSPDERLGDLRDCFYVMGELQIFYSFTEVWG